MICQEEEMRTKVLVLVFKVDVHVYDNNLVDIGDGIGARRVTEEFDSVLATFPYMEKVGK